ncbi:hypothetical protein BO94DRAFT_529532 [Aspergillus sclerotioniger CBS 115572]|uniref:F-box domain-containing protein n=1 Tax=Aspergillus sclerotioniger CBS 115572 TaxID=1450535 RepID=A0A317XGP2_9EURO|nr:hypothetical protein BO94DRAFT_529532 [Aspergillus sclerotioniger CBS 115572]PWY96120.1 hypothetical protein BO94DRAFT_529532 [Aspergillus sclerotioniger CBS 115572]
MNAPLRSSSMANANKCYLSSLPAEIITHVFTLLPALGDVLNLAAACSRHQQIWQQNADQIHRHAGPRSIECLHHARIYLADQGGAQPNTTLTARDVVQLVRNSSAVEKTLDLFNQKYVAYLLTPEAGRDRTFINLRPNRRPHLSPSERHRFIRAIYQLWGLLILTPEARASRMASLKLKSVMTISDVANGYRDIEDVIMTVKADGVLLWDIANELYEVRDQIVAQVLQHPNHTRSMPWEYGWEGCISIWDVWHEGFKELVTEPGARNITPPVSEVWYDTSDEK